MTWDELRVQWDELSLLARRKWSRLTARDLRVIAGNRERLVGVLQVHYGAHRRTIEREVRAFTRSVQLPR
ncbi:MAG: CsbD family protein [Gemmatimonadales bacterium]